MAEKPNASATRDCADPRSEARPRNVRGGRKSHVATRATRLRRVRDRVLREAKITPGDRLLDLGAGRGLVALGARKRLTDEGSVVACDLSLGALLECRRRADEEDPAGGRLHLVGGDALALPFRADVFDAATTRSVLMYVKDRRRALQELFRVLRPGGRLSIFEPINRVSENPGPWGGPLDARQVERDRARVRRYLEERSEFFERMSGFDERDLVREFVEASFAPVTLEYEYHEERRRYAKREAAAYLSIRLIPGTVSYEEAARAVLGERADEHLQRYFDLLVSHSFRIVWAVAYLRGTKPKT